MRKKERRREKDEKEREKEEENDMGETERECTRDITYQYNKKGPSRENHHRVLGVAQ